MLLRSETDRIETLEAEDTAKMSVALEWLRQTNASGGAVYLSHYVGDTDTRVELPASAVELLGQALSLLEAGKGVTLTPVQAELTTGQAADLLNVSRTYLIKLLEEGSIAFHKVGRHRRILREDVMRYRNVMRGKRRDALDQLAAESQAYGIGYD